MTPPEVSAEDAIGEELSRVARRWQQLPLGHAHAQAPSIAAEVQRLADAVASEHGWIQTVVPDLGPAVLIDQLRVMVYDYLQTDLPPEPLLESLTRLRRGLP